MQKLYTANEANLIVELGFVFLILDIFPELIMYYGQQIKRKWEQNVVNLMLIPVDTHCCSDFSCWNLSCLF